MSRLKVVYILVLFLFSAAVVTQADDENSDMIFKEDLKWHDVHDAHDQQMLKEADEEILKTKNEMAQISEDDPPLPQQESNQTDAQQEDVKTKKEIVRLPKSVPQQSIQEHPENNYGKLAIGSETSYISYRESVKGSTFMKEKGVMSGINSSYTLRPPPGDILNFDDLDFYRLDARFDHGEVKYEGSNIFNGISDYMVEIRGLLGKDFNFYSDSVRLTPYFGIGYRSLYDSLVEDKPHGYNRWIQYLYIPTGAEVMAQIKDGWAIGADAEYDFFTYGHVTSYLGEIGAGDLGNIQEHGYGLRGSLKLEKKWSRFNFILEPYVRYWHIHNSRVNTSAPFLYNGQYYVIVGFEPDNTSTEIGGKISIEF